MNLVALEKEIERLAEELRLSGEYADGRFIDVRAEIDRVKLEVEALRRFLERAFPSFGPDLERIKTEIVQEFDPEFER